MKNITAKILCLVTSIAMCLSIFTFVACSEDGGLDGEPEEMYYTVTFDANGGIFADSTTTVTVTTDASGRVALPASDPVRTDYTFAGYNSASDGTGDSVTATTVYQSSVTVYAIWTANQPGNVIPETPDEGTGSEENDGKIDYTPSDVLGNEYIVYHNEGDTVQYTFEAEYTNLENKSGPASSGEYPGKAMAQTGEGASNGAFVNGLKRNGNSINFIVVSDREVQNATLILRLGEESNLTLTYTAQKFQIRVDPVPAGDLNSYLQAGAWGDWDTWFLNWYKADGTGKGEFNGYILDSWYCGDITISVNTMNASNFNDYTVCLDGLHLYEGVNSISLITNNTDVPSRGDTYEATAPIVDCIRIITGAQLGMYRPESNIDGLPLENACTYVKVDN